MIYSVKAKVISYVDSNLILDFGSIKISCYMPQPERLNLDTEYELFSFLSWNSDSGPSLYCFFEEAERKVFELLIGCPGIGPKIAITILHNISINILCDSIINEKINVITKIPGIGLKKAEMIILKLKNNLSKIIPTKLVENNNLDDILNALRTLGYSQVEILPIVKKVLKDSKESLSINDSILKVLQEI
jgi:Holliday junction DNA helicase RuvA